MNSREYYEYFIKARRKVEQILRLQLKLEQKIQSLLNFLKNTQNREDIIANLRQLKEYYGRELRIIEICEKGVKDISNILPTVEEQYKSRFNTLKRAKARFSILIKKEDYESLLIYTLHQMIPELKWQIAYLNKNSYDLKKIIEEQRSVVLKLLKQNEEYYDKDSFEGNLIELLELRTREMDLLDSIKRKNSPNRVNIIITKVKEFLGVMDEIAEKNAVTRVLRNSLKKHPTLAAIQAIWAPMPDFSVGSPFVAFYFGVLYLPPFLVVCYILEWSPSLMALAIETTREVKVRIK